MENSITYKLEKFEGPLDLLLSLVQKNKMDIRDIQISVICEQYAAYLEQAAELNIELAAEFLVMAAELLLIKSRMLLPREEPEEEDPRARLAEAIARLEAAKRAAAVLSGRYAKYCGRLEKDAEEISPDRSFVADQDPERLYTLMRRMLAELKSTDLQQEVLVRPLVTRRVVPVELKIFGIIKHFEGREETGATLGELLLDAEDRPELVAIFIGVLELVKMKRILIADAHDLGDNLCRADALFTVNPEFAGRLAEGIKIEGYGEPEEGAAQNNEE